MDELKKKLYCNLNRNSYLAKMIECAVYLVNSNKKQQSFDICHQFFGSTQK